ncbi:MAG: hypothetical protein MZW92_51980 [Comamonadaceae bacterium]|nr:hypothetical protein [Comamonadaceae bacterium]
MQNIDKALDEGKEEDTVAWKNDSTRCGRDDHAGEELRARRQKVPRRAHPQHIQDPEGRGQLQFLPGQERQVAARPMSAG